MAGADGMISCLLSTLSLFSFARFRLLGQNETLQIVTVTSTLDEFPVILCVAQ